jgi:hypothetical protein
MEELLHELIEGYLRRAGVEDERITCILRNGPLSATARALSRFVPSDGAEDVLDNLPLEW